jgi:hypothetical protein
VALLTAWVVASGMAGAVATAKSVPTISASVRRMTATASAVVGLWATSAGATDLRPEDAVRHIGETATVCGLVASAMFEANVQDRLTL